jgi:hypothetical protein
MSSVAESYSAVKGTVNHSPAFRNRIYIWMATLRFRGMRGAFSHYSQRLVGVLTRGHGKDGAVLCDERFTAESSDDRFECLAIQSPNTKWGMYYWPTHEDVFHKTIQSLPIRLSDYSFIDLGAGKGLPLLLASKYSFKSITGVEYSKTLADAANLNIRSYEERTGSQARSSCIWGDAAEFVFPDEPTVIYLFNPFQGKVMDRVIANIERSLQSAPRDLWVIYVNPWENRKFRRSRMFETIEWNSEYSLHRSVRR